jgi:hypothetical protein
MDWATYITDLDIPNDWDYDGYHHAVLPSYIIEDANMVVYIDSHDKNERLRNSKEWNSCATIDNLNPRFTVFNSDYATGNTLDIPEELLATNHFNEVLKFAKERSK